jgi:glucose/arabinose dehydrogenase
MTTYTFYLAPTGFNRISRLDVDRGTNIILSEKIVVDGIPASDAGRNGGAMTIGPDGCLYVAIGDAGQPAQAQNLASLSGKILRVWPDDVTREVWARGLRDPRHLGFDEAGGLFVTECDADDALRVRLVTRGANLGTAPHSCHRRAVPSSSRVPSNEIDERLLPEGGSYTDRTLPPEGGSHTSG